MKTKYEELPMVEETKTESVNISKESSVEMKESSETSSSTEELTTMESVPESLDVTKDTKEVAEDEDIKEDVPGEEDEDLKTKYVKLIEHNSKLVDLLKTTMQIQTDMFRKLIHYVFP